ncbi:alkaline phosphatase PhoX [Cesiribacter andamanensis]|uniref:Putative phosphatase n=1 Tax=Cesiribacter andamanensis AMV16 TaxID=1279009 RepID=M7N3N6_9BACT|nr:alkaline phosphatase PhoX [Cesiribacter andamanensis]EMR01907.1 putative phosphatase [Cesiribacter andamanensis AMV16]
MIFKNVLSLAAASLFFMTSCEQQLTQEALDQNSAANKSEKLKKKDLQAYSVTPSFLALHPQFKNVEIYPLISSEDRLPNSPDFVYGSMTDGLGLLRNQEGGFTLINNIEADYAIARITFDENFRPVHGEHILNAIATASTAQCSGTLITPEEHGFGPLYLSGGEWGGSSKGVFLVNPFRDAASADVPEMLTTLGQWSTENAVPIGKDAYPGKTVIFIGDDHSDNAVPSGQLGMYVAETGDLHGGKLYGLKVTSAGVDYEMDMQEGTSYDMEFVELTETNIDLLDAEAKAKGVMGFSRLEDIDWRRGSAKNNREVYLAVTGRKHAALQGKGTFYGRVYKVELNDADPTKGGKITCVLDGDKLDGKAKAFHSPDNILVTRNYAYIQEDPNGYPDTPDKAHFARLYQYNLNTGELKTVLECDQETAAAQGYGRVNDTWEITGMIDVSDILGIEGTFLLGVQNHGWVKADGTPFTDPKANLNVAGSAKEGSQLFLIRGLKR